MKFDKFENLEVGNIIEYYGDSVKKSTEEIILRKNNDNTFNTCIVKSFNEYYYNGQDSMIFSDNCSFKIIGKADMNVFNVLFEDINE